MHPSFHFQSPSFHWEDKASKTSLTNNGLLLSFATKNLKIELVACLTVEAGCLRYKQKVLVYRNQEGRRCAGGICYKIMINYYKIIWTT